MQQPAPPESGTSLAGAQITARQAQQAGAKARQQAKQAQRQAERAQAAPEETGLRVGVAPGSADPVTVRDGVVHIGEYEAVNYDSGEPVTVPKGSTRADVARALKDAGVLSSRQKMFGLSEKAQEVMFSRSAGGQPTDFVPNPDGGLDYGEITPEMGRAMRRQAGKIRLRQGNEAWGLTHIRNRHLDQFQRLGFDSAEAFVASVAANFTAIYQRPGSALDVVFAQSGTGQRLAVQLEPSVDGDFYDVKTASPVRADQFKRLGW